MPLQTSTPRLRPVIRVFVSSTFSDMKHERNALAAEVYPKLEELCQKNGFQFQAIDLRWGISTEAGLDHRTMRICFDELRRAQEISPEPNFLVLLGDRYGWRPLPEAISAMEFEELKRVVTTNLTKATNSPSTPLRAGTNGEDRRGQGLDPLAVLRAWYRCDENVLLPEPQEADPDRVPLNYILQPRQNLGEGRDYTRTKDGKDTQDWMDVQQVLWSLINTAFPNADRWFDGLDWTRHVAEVNDPQHPKRAIPQLARFQASATEQEIWCGALSATNAERHVIACFREIATRDDFAPADAKDFFDVTEEEFEEASARRQTDLKEAIKFRLGENKPLSIPFTRLRRENSKVVMDASRAGTRVFCAAVLKRFRPIVKRQIKEYWEKSEQGSTERAERELKIEQDEHERFGRERGGRESFVGREAELKVICAYLRNASTQPLVVHGSSGCGKTALLARAAEQKQRTEVGGQRSEVIVRFIGTTSHSSDIRSLLASLCQELRLRYPREGELPTDIKELCDEFDQHLHSATPEQPLILFLDALDQLSDADGGRLLDWIPTGPLPGHVKLVVSCLSDRAPGHSSGQPYSELQRRQLIEKNSVNLDALSEDEARTLLFDRWLHQAGRTVSLGQRERIEQRLASAVCRQPIYLKLLFEEVRLWRSYDKKRSLGATVSKMLARFFVRLRQPGNHGRLLVKRVLGYLAASRHGLAENEMLEVLFADPRYKLALDLATEQTRHELPLNATRIPIAIWSRLRFDLAPYLAERAAPGANVLTFYHRQVAEWVEERFAKAATIDWQPHRCLASYFSGRADPTQEGSFVEDHRALAELLFHLVSCGECVRAQSLLGDLRYLDARCSTGSAAELLGDYLLPGRIDNPNAECLRAFILLHVQSLEKYPESFFSLVHHDGPALARELVANLLAKGLWKKPWLRTARIPLPCPNKAAGRQAAVTPLRRCRFERSCAVGFACGPMIVFRLKSLGEVALFDLDGLVELPQRISIRRLRPRVLFASDDACHLAIAYENGDAEVIKLHWSATGTLSSHSEAATFRYHLPEMDLPVMAWHGGGLVYQEDEQNLTCLALDAPVSALRHHRLPANACGELSAIAFVESRMVASFRVGTSGTIVCFGPSGIEGTQHRQGAQALQVSPCGGSRVAAAWSDHRLCSYDTNRQLHPLDEVSVKDQPIKLAWVDGMFVWCTYSGELHAWTPADGPPVHTHLAGDTLVCPGGSRVANWQTQALVDGSLVTVTDAGATVFRVSFEEAAAAPQIYAVFEPSQGQVLAIQKRDDGAWLIDPARKREALLTTEQEMRLNPECGVDGQHLLLATVARSGVRVTLETQDVRPCGNLPLGINAVTGDPHGGFWLADRMGQILRITEDGRCTVAATIPLRGVSGPSLLCTQRFLIWAGTCFSHQESGEDMAHAFVFYRRTPTGLEMLGKRILKKCEGHVEAFDYSDARDLLVVAIRRSEGITHGFRKGTIDQYLQGEELLLPRPQTINVVVGLRFAGDDATVQLLSGDGAFLVMGLEDWRVQGVLKPAMPFTGMTRGPSTASRALIVADRTDLFSYTLKEPHEPPIAD